MSLSLVACAGEKEAASSDPAAPSVDTSEGVEPRVLRLSTHLNVENGVTQKAMKFGELLQEKTNGALMVDIYTDGQLGGQTDNCESLISGTLDMTLVDTGTLANYQPKFSRRMFLPARIRPSQLLLVKLISS